VPGLSVRFEAYLAATTNTFQIGGRLDVGFNVGMTAEGHIDVDAIFQYRPFHFDVDISGELRVGVLGRTFAGVDVHGHLSGPGPIVLRAGISIDLWLDDFTWDETFTIGRGVSDVLPAQFLISPLTQALTPSDIRARGGDDRHVVVRPAPATSVSLVSPLGTLVFSQNHAPLGLPLERFGGAPLVMPTTADVTPVVRVNAQGQDIAVTVGGDASDYFAPGVYLSLDKAEALNQPPYDYLKAGFEMHLAPAAATPAPLEVKYVEYYRGRVPKFLGALFLRDPAVLGLANQRAAAADVTDRTPLVTVASEAWATHAPGGVVTPAPSRTAAHVAVRRGAAAVALPVSDTPISLAGVA
jgi:hypothetical protein